MDEVQNKNENKYINLFSLYIRVLEIFFYQCVIEYAFDDIFNNDKLFDWESSVFSGLSNPIQVADDIGVDTRVTFTGTTESP